MNLQKHPESLNNVNSLKITDELKTFVNELASDIDTETANRSTWESNIDKAVGLRYGIRNRKTTPWIGCSNFSVPLADTHINNNKTAYVNLLNADPICTFIPYGGSLGGDYLEMARKKELLFDWRLRTKVKFFEPYNYAVDICLEQGAVIWKTIWKFSTVTYTEYIDLEDFNEEVLGALYDNRVDDEMLMKILEEEYGIDMAFQENYEAVLKAVQKFREGSTRLEIKLVERKDNQPECIPLSLRDDVVIPIETTNIQEALFIDHKVWRTVNDVKIDMMNGKYQNYKDDIVKAWAGGYSRRKNKKSSTVVSDKMILIHEVCCWYDVNDDGIEERCIVTYPENNPDDILRFIEVPYDHGMFPYVLVKREFNDKSAYSARGYPYLDEDYQVGISKSLNQAIDSGDVAMPRLVYKKNAVSNVKSMRYTPMESIEVVNGSVDDVRFEYPAAMNQPILFQQAQYLKSWADARVGNVQAAFSDPTNMTGGGLQGQRTKYEAQMIAMNQGGIQSLDLLVWQWQMAEVFYQMDALYDQFGDDEEEVTITGEPPLKVNRREIQGKYHVMPNGRLENTDPMIRAAKTFNLMRVFMGDEDIKQAELKKLYIMDYDPRIARKIMLSDEERAQRDQMKQQIQAQVKQAAQSDAISMKHISNLLEVDKEQMLSTIPRREIVVDYNDNDSDGDSKGKKNPLRQSSRSKKSTVTYGG